MNEFVGMQLSPEKSKILDLLCMMFKIHHFPIGRSFSLDDLFFSSLSFFFSLLLRIEISVHYRSAFSLRRLAPVA